MYWRGVGLSAAQALVGFGALVFFAGAVVIYLFLSIYILLYGFGGWLALLLVPGPARDAFLFASGLVAGGLILSVIGWAWSRSLERAPPPPLRPQVGRFGTAGEWVIGAYR